MTMQRYCPSCKGAVDVLGDYFCLRCGQKLPGEMSSVDVRSQKLKTEPPSFIIKTSFARPKYLGRILIVLLFSLLLVGGVYFGLRFFYLGTQVSPKATNSALGVERLLTLDGLAMPSASFDSTEFSALIPFDAKFYLEGTSFKAFLDYFFTPNSESKAPVLSVPVGNIDSLFSGKFAFFISTIESTSSASYGFVSKVKDKSSFPLSDVEKSVKEASMSVALLDSYLLVYNNPEVLKDVTSSKNKVALNLSLNSKYAVAKNVLPKEAKMQMYIAGEGAYAALDSFSRTDFAPEKLKLLIADLVEKNKTSYAVK